MRFNICILSPYAAIRRILRWVLLNSLSLRSLTETSLWASPICKKADLTSALYTLQRFYYASGSRMQRTACEHTIKSFESRFLRLSSFLCSAILKFNLRPPLSSLFTLYSEWLLITIEPSRILVFEIFSQSKERLLFSLIKFTQDKLLKTMCLLFQEGIFSRSILICFHAQLVQYQWERQMFFQICDHFLYSLHFQSMIAHFVKFHFSYWVFLFRRHHKE